MGMGLCRIFVERCRAFELVHSLVGHHLDIMDWHRSWVSKPSGAIGRGWLHRKIPDNTRVSILWKIKISHLKVHDVMVQPSSETMRKQNEIWAWLLTAGPVSASCVSSPGDLPRAPSSQCAIRR